MKHVTVACITGGDPEKLIRIPNLAGFGKTEVVIPNHPAILMTTAIRNTGATIIEVNTPEELENALNARTAMIYIMAYDESQPWPAALP
jgi:2-methylisocitrate lyase-like PEP mutase family enzyme